MLGTYFIPFYTVMLMIRRELNKINVLLSRVYSGAAPEPCKKDSTVKDTGSKKQGKDCTKKPVSQVDPQRVFKIYRYGGALTKDKPQLVSYDLDVRTCGNMVLDAMIKIKDMDPGFTFRRSCREGICGSCGINLQGKNCLACVTAIPKDKTITIHPLPHMYVIRDLVVDMTHFFNAYDSIHPYLMRTSDNRGRTQYAQSMNDNSKMVGLYECVLCSCCSTACPSYWWNGRRFLGPAALLHAYRWIIDSRDTNHEQRLSELRDDFKAFRCHTIYNCTLSCPKGLNPALAIARLKKLISGVDQKPKPDMDPMKFSQGGGGLSECAKKCSK